MDSKYDVSGLGNALVDALVRIDDDAVLASLGVPKGQMTPVDHARWQRAFEQVQHHGVDIQSGGSCANTIAALGLMGAKAIYCGQVGDDQLGHLYAQRMREACKQDALKWTKKANTGKCLSLISKDAERTMLTDLGAAVTMDGLGSFANDIRDSSVLHVTGYLLLGEPMSERCMEAIAVAEQEEITISLDVADPFVVGMVRDQMWHVIEEFADVVFLNEEEARALTGKEAGAAISQIGEHVEVVILKLGARGSLVQAHGVLHSVGIHPADAVDTTGAGDAYAAGYLYGHALGWDPARSADLGARVAAMTVSQVGAVVRDAAALQAAVQAAANA